ASTFTATPNACGGDVTETWTATDACGRTVASVSRTIHVSPAALPVFDAVSDITVACGGATTHTINYSNGLSGNCNISGTATSTLGSIPPACGDVLETWTKTDACGRTITTSRTIHIVDNTPPTITTCAPNVTVNPNHAGCTAVLADYRSLVTATDNCGVTLTQSPLAGTALPLGPNTINITAKDGCGNSSTCQFIVTVTSTLTATCSSSNPELYFGYTGDQTSIITATPSGGTGPYTVNITMSRPLLCNQITDAGDEVWTGGSGGLTSGNGCLAFPNTSSSTPVSTKTINSGSYSVTVTLMADAWIISTITDVNGCQKTCSTFVHADDVRCFAGKSNIVKVTLCHKTGSAKNPCVTICVDEDAVAEHLAHGDFLGKCTLNCLPPASVSSSTNSVSYTGTKIVEPTEKLKVKILPNPATGKSEFILRAEGSSNEIMQIVVMDMYGKVIHTAKGSVNGDYRFGAQFVSGMYIVKVLHGKDIATYKIVKTK
ncbi:MAG: T9SS type A sorting domain-containing protein, partial [Panacibacter sp.]